LTNSSGFSISHCSAETAGETAQPSDTVLTTLAIQHKMVLRLIEMLNFPVIIARSYG
jgi:hypothetical protein